MLGKLWPILIGVAVGLAALVAMRPLLPIDETRYLSVAWEMWLSGDPVHLTKNGEMYTHKTPLLFAMINLVWLLTGVNEFAARLVGPACAVGMVAGTTLLARRLWPAENLGIRAALILAGFPVFLIYGSATMFDALLALGVLGGIAALWSIGQGRGGWPLFGLALAFGVYAKGPVILVHLMPVLLTMPYWAPNPPKATEIAKGFGGALLVALALIALWLVPTLLTATPEFRTELLWTQSAARVAGGMAHDRPFWFLIALLPLLLFPWGWSIRLWSGFKGTWSDPAIKLCTIWAVSTLILFSLISGKQAHYLLPAYPAMALLFAHASIRAKSGSLAWVALLLIAAGAGAVGLGLIPAKADLAQLAPYWPLTAFAALCLILALLIWRLPRIPGHLLAGAGLTLGIHAIIASTGLYAAYDGQRLATTLASNEEGGLAVINEEYNAEINFLARLTTKVALTPDLPSLTAWAQTHPNGMIFGRVKENPLTAAPQQVFHFFAQDWGLWPATSLGSIPSD
jgi:4-amino-4-deoxy-L-arabinose transferase-like glycosyltransferase